MKLEGTIVDVFSPLDLHKNEIRNGVIQNLASAPSSPVNGQIYDDTALGNKAFLRVGAAWEKILSGQTIAGDYGAGSIVNADIGAAAGITYGKLSLTNSIVNADIAAAAAIAYSKLALSNSIVNGDIAAGAAIVYSKLALTNTIVNADIAAAAAIVYSKLNLAGSIVNADVSASAAIAYSKLNLSASIVNADVAAGAAIAFTKLGAPTADFSFAGFKITNVADPISGTDAANKQYVDSARAGLDLKDSVRVATAAALPTNTRSGNVLTASANGVLAAVDGVTLVVNDRVLVKDESTTANNGIYFVSSVGSGGTPWTMTRAIDADANAEVTSGMFTFAEEGTVNVDTAFTLTTNNPITLNTTGLTFTIYSRAESIVAGTGLTKSSNTLNVGAGTGITVNADDVALTIPVLVTSGGTGATTAAGARTNLGTIGKYSSATHGSGTTITITQATHGCAADGTNQVEVYEVATGDKVYPEININNANGTVTITFYASQSANSHRVNIQG